MSINKLKDPQNKNDNKYKPLSSDVQNTIHEMWSRDISGEDMIEEIGRFFYPILKEKIENKEMEYLGEGQEGKIFKIIMRLHNDKDIAFVVIKKRIDGEAEKEIKKQNEFFIVSKNTNSGVKVPKVINRPLITNDGENYMIMEYINGKTLYALVMEKIMERLYKDNQEFKSHFESLKRFRKLESQDKLNPNKRSLFDFPTDYDANNALYKAINFLVSNTKYINKYIDGSSQNDAAGSYILDKKGLDAVLTKIYYSFSKEIFEKKEINDIRNKVNEFLIACHKQGHFHRDIGGNTKNLMFEFSEYKGIVPVFIDFGKSILNFRGSKIEYPKGEGPYHESGFEGEGSGYIPDSHIISIISGYEIKEKDDYELWVEEMKNPEGTVYQKCLRKMNDLKYVLKIQKEIVFYRKSNIKNLISDDSKNPGYYNIFLEYGGTKKRDNRDYLSPIYLVDYNKEKNSIIDDDRMRATIFENLICLTMDDFQKIKELFIQESGKNKKRHTYAKYFLEFIYKIEEYLY